MSGFNYGGVGDGTPWSSERGRGPEPGGGGQSHAGDRDNSGNNSSGTASPVQQQMVAIQIEDKLHGVDNLRVLTPKRHIEIHKGN